MSRTSLGGSSYPESDTPVFKGASLNNFHFSDATHSLNTANSPQPELGKKVRTPVILHIKLAENIMREIRCFDDDNPQVLAMKFCEDNGLPPSLVPVIEKMIQAQFSQAAPKKNNQASKQGSLSKQAKMDHHMLSPKMGDVDPNMSNVQNSLVNDRSISPKSQKSAVSPQQKSRHKKPKLIAKMNVNITPSESKELLLYEGEDPAEVAYRFHSENNLPPQLVEVLTKQLMSAQEQYYVKKGKTSEVNSTLTKGMTSRNESPSVQQLERSSHIGSKEDLKHSAMSKKSDRILSNEVTQPKSPVQNPMDQEIKSAVSQKEADSSKGIIKEQNQHDIRTNHSPDEESRRGRSPLSPNDRRDGTNVAETYEKWQTLMSSKLKMKQSEHPLTEGKNSSRSNTSRSRSKEPKRDLTADKMYKLALRSLTPTKQNDAKSTATSQHETPSKEDQRKFKKHEEKEMVSRLYDDAKTRKAVRDEYRLLDIGLRTLTDTDASKRSTSPWREGEDPLNTTDNSTIAKGSKSRKERELIAQEKRRRENFTFKPVVSGASQSLAASRTRSTSPIHEKLYEESKTLREDRERLQIVGIEETHPFKPQIPTHSRGVEPGFLDRVAKRRADDRHNELMKRQTEMSNPIDLNTGQKLFTPVITKNKYYRKLKQEEEKSQLELKATRLLERSGRVPKGFREIFDKLDHDGDGYISAKSIELSDLDVETLNALMDIFGVIENKNLTVDFLGFVQLIQAKLSSEKQDVLEGSVENEISRSNILLSPGRKGQKVEYSNILSDTSFKAKNRSPPGRKAKHEEIERIKPEDLTKHYQRMLKKNVMI